MTALATGLQQERPQAPGGQAPTAGARSQQPGASSPQQPTREVPNTDSVSALPRKDRRSAKKLAEFVNEQYRLGLDLRRPHAISWIKVKSIMRNIHYFKIRNGTWYPLRKKEGEIRAVRKLMKPRYRWELGRLNANQIGVSATPKLGQGERSYFWAERAEAIMPDWMEMEQVQETYDTANQHLLYYGMVGYYRYIDQFNARVRLKAVPGTEYFPIPYNATSMEEADGLMRVQLVSKQWLETQDDHIANTTGESNLKKMADSAEKRSLTLSSGFAGIGSPDRAGGEMEGAVVTSVWMKPNALNPQGLWMFLVGNELFRFKGEEDENGPVLRNGKIPHEIVYYTKQPDDFWGYGFCEDMYSEQIEANRQLTDLIKNARRNRGITVIDGEAIDVKDIQDEESALVVARSGSFDNRVPLAHFPPQAASRDVGAILALIEQGADKAVGYESDIIVGRQEGRTEGGPATSLLNANAQLPLQPVIDRTFRALKRTYPEILDMIREVWPDEKTIKSPGELGREMLIRKDDVPTSEQVVLTPNPMLVGGRNAMMQILFQLRQMPADDGTGFEVKSREFRRSLRLMNANPPGLDLVDKREQRIQFRIGLLINDGQNPAVASAMDDGNPELRFEDHRLAIELLKEKILDPGYNFYGPKVKLALNAELEFHANFIGSSFPHPDRFDDDVEDEDAIRSENFLSAAEQDLSGFEGQVVLNGQPVGVGA